MLLRYQNQQIDLKDIEAAIFDLDGTLVESEPVWAEAKLYVAKHENVNVNEHVLLAYVGRSVADFVKEVIAPANVQLIEAAIVERALSHYDSSVSEISGASFLVREFSKMALPQRFAHLHRKKQFKKASDYWVLNRASTRSYLLSSWQRGSPISFHMPKLCAD
jgi:beta-phosphoglucomutase-like phosphatase (HAD superfamily)